MTVPDDVAPLLYGSGSYPRQLVRSWLWRLRLRANRLGPEVFRVRGLGFWVWGLGFRTFRIGYAMYTCLSPSPRRWRNPVRSLCLCPFRGRYFTPKAPITIGNRNGYPSTTDWSLFLRSPSRSDELFCL